MNSLHYSISKFSSAINETFRYILGTIDRSVDGLRHALHDALDSLGAFLRGLRALLPLAFDTQACGRSIFQVAMIKTAAEVIVTHAESLLSVAPRFAPFARVVVLLILYLRERGLLLERVLTLLMRSPFLAQAVLPIAIATLAVLTFAVLTLTIGALLIEAFRLLGHRRIGISWLLHHRFLSRLLFRLGYTLLLNLTRRSDLVFPSARGGALVVTLPGD